GVVESREAIVAVSSGGAAQEDPAAASQLRPLRAEPCARRQEAAVDAGDEEAAAVEGVPDVFAPVGEGGDRHRRVPNAVELACDGGAARRSARRPRMRLR